MSSMPLSPTHTLVVEPPPQLPLAQRLLLLFMFCLVQFLDAFNVSTVFSAMPALEQSLRITTSQSVWIVSTYQLTFAPSLLISGRISDIHNPKFVFAGGISAFGLISLGAGFANDSVTLSVLRGLSGIACGMTIPSALALLVKVFPDPAQQARAIGIFGGCGAIADVLGFLVGAMLVQLASFRWLFWLVSLVSIPVGLGCFLIMPAQIEKAPGDHEVPTKEHKNLDIVGVSMLTVAIVLFIFAVTSGPAQGWDSPAVLASLTVSILTTVAFFYWEILLPAEMAVIPPSTWFYQNFAVLFGLALLPFFWWTTVYIIFMNLWQEVFHWSAISASVRMIPVGMIAFLMSFVGGILSRIVSPKWIILLGLSLMCVATAGFALAGGNPDQYWCFILPALLVGSTGTMLTFTHTNIAILQTAPSSMAGTVGAIFNGALQIGSAIGLAAVISIEASVETGHGGPGEYHGRAAAFWFLLGVIILEMMTVSCFYHRNGADTPTREKCNASPEGGDGITTVS